MQENIVMKMKRSLLMRILRKPGTGCLQKLKLAVRLVTSLLKSKTAISSQPLLIYMALRKNSFRSIKVC